MLSRPACGGKSLGLEGTVVVSRLTMSSTSISVMSFTMTDTAVQYL